MSLVEIDLYSMTEAKAESFINEMREKSLALVTFLPFSEKGMQIFRKHFMCLRCGQCCNGIILHEKGIAITSRELNRLKRYRKAKVLRQMLLTRNDGTLALKLPCPFYNEHKKPTCTIYEDRPSICKTYPLDEPVPIGPEERLCITVDPYCPAACNLFKDVVSMLRSHL
ncbi:MAG: YkgJ family cysteine cluster protein [Dehalococcoidia bacterium]